MKDNGYAAVWRSYQQGGPQQDPPSPPSSDTTLGSNGAIAMSVGAAVSWGVAENAGRVQCYHVARIRRPIGAAASSQGGFSVCSAASA